MAPFTVPKRIRDKRNTVRREILATIDELCFVSGAELRRDALRRVPLRRR
jgi:hypothetical protein